MHVAPVGLEIDDGIADKLAGTVIRDVAAASGFEQRDALRGECLNILQNPNGAPKRVALRQNRFTALLERFVHYESDTLPGSSGSPVFNDQWQVICLHHAGVPLMD